MWKDSISSSRLVPKMLDLTFDGVMQQIDIDRVVSRRQERKAESVGGIMDKENFTRSLEQIDNDTATVLAVDQLLDTSFLISDEELACYVPPIDMEIVAVRRDHV
ncbi:unnamed protein product [Thelazia callipaeda]|uniref:Reverse transcriptase n=1 Tax=Thelazia callipaeda TaxID=103827 RepID=A0A0N5CNQ5_THECL|nr:unnamed protein product [Thelazia callipaeda]